MEEWKCWYCKCDNAEHEMWCTNCRNSMYSSKLREQYDAAFPFNSQPYSLEDAATALRIKFGGSDGHVVRKIQKVRLNI